jgi:hypothetical protein
MRTHFYVHVKRYNLKSFQNITTKNPPKTPKKAPKTPFFSKMEGFCPFLGKNV